MSNANHRAAVIAQQVAPSSMPAEQPVGLGLTRQETSSAQAGAAERVYSVQLPEKLTPEGPWTVRRSAASPHKLVSSFPAPDNDVRTLHDTLEKSVGRYPHMPFLGTRKRDDKGKLGPYTWMTYAQAGDVRTSIGSGLLQLGLTPRSTIGLYSVNCREWVLVDSALHAYGFISVPLYDTLGPDAVEYITNHAELAAVACSAAVAPNIIAVLPKCPSLKVLLVYGSSGTGRLPEAPPGSSCRVVSLEQVESLGRRHPKAHIPPKPSDVATLCYTSGTTGVPKGAVLTHGNLVASAAGISTVLEKWQPGERHISYLPLAHIYERINLVVCVHLGASVGFYSGNVLELLDDVATLKPHVFVSVPRLWNRIYDRVMAQVRQSGPVARALFDRAYAYKRGCLERGQDGGRWGHLYDLLIFSKIRAKLGGDVKYMTTGASPISDEVMMFLRVCFGATVLEGYGMTESASAMTITRPEDFTTGHVGAPLPCGEIKLVDIPEMNYLNSDKPYPRGEVCVRGPTVFAGYFKDAVQTQEVLDEDGWLHTGDVGCWLPGGRLKIIDRKKNIFKLAQGEYIAPEKIENVYQKSPFVAQVFVYGDSLRAQLVAVVVPDPEVLLPWAKERGMGDSMPELCNNAHVREAVMRSMAEEARVAQLRGFEQVQGLHLHPEMFTVENNLLTPTFKLKRPQAKIAFQSAIDAMYAALPANAGV